MRLDIAGRLILWACGREPDFIIGGAERPYLRRWWIVRNRLLCVYVHQFMRSDDDRALHDHPWLFNASWLLLGEYTEHTVRAGGIAVRTHRRAGDWKLRLGPAPHRVELHVDPAWDGVLRPGAICLAEPCERPCWTLFITGPRYRSWGFHCPDRGWIHWKRFTAADDPGAIGKGCDA